MWFFLYIEASPPGFDHSSSSTISQCLHSIAYRKQSLEIKFLCRLFPHHNPKLLRSFISISLIFVRNSLFFYTFTTFRLSPSCPIGTVELVVSAHTTLIFTLLASSAVNGKPALAVTLARKATKRTKTRMPPWHSPKPSNIAGRLDSYAYGALCAGCLCYHR